MIKFGKKFWNFGKNPTGISKNIIFSGKHVFFDLDKHFPHVNTSKYYSSVLKGYLKDTVRRNTKQTDQISSWSSDFQWFLVNYTKLTIF